MKVSGSYASLVAGISQQIPELRRPGQLTAQVNMLPDPVEGLTRRPGSMYKASFAISPFTESLIPSVVKTWDKITHSAEGKDYVVLYRKASAPGGHPVLVVYNKTTSQFIPVVKGAGVDTAVEALFNNGVSAITSAGRYVFLAANNTVITGTSEQLWNAGTLADKAAVWIRGPAYSRRFTLTLTKSSNWTFTAGGATTGLTIDGTDAKKAYVEYTSLSSQYSGVLDTSDIPFTATDYQKQVNDRVNAYQSAVNQWITTAAKGVVPNSISSQLGRVTMYNAGTTGSPNWQPRLTGYMAYMIQGIESSLPVLNTQDATLYISGVTSVSVSDDADGSLIRAVCNEVKNTSDVTTHHWYDKVVKIKPSGAEDALYLKAVKKDSAQVGDKGEVTWVECPGKKHTITGGLFMMTIVGDVAYVASSAYHLNALTASSDHPAWAESKCGDDDTSPMPFFVGRQITLLATFQGRLVIGSGSVLNFSASKDFLDFFRKTTLSSLPDDPMEIAPSDSFSDTLRHAVLFDKDLVVFGDKRQYGVSGNTVLVPSGANMSIRASIPDAAQAAPVTHNGFIFYAQPGEHAASVHQVVVGQTEDSIQSFSVSSQLSKYIEGNPVSLEIHSKPDMIFVRSTEVSDRIYTFAYIDTEQGRKQDAWYEWRFNTNMGRVMAVDRGTDGPLIFFMRNGGSYFYVDVHSVPITGGLSDRPFLDGLRQWTSGPAPAGMCAAFGAAGEQRFEGLYPGATEEQIAALAASYPSAPVWLGYPQEAYAIPTNPFPTDDNGKPITTGRTVVSFFVVSYKNSTGFKWELTTEAGVKSGEFNGRIIGDPENLVGIVPFASGSRSVLVLEEVRTFTFKLQAVDWFPLTLAALEWVGQNFNNIKR